jgi:hypothetical protein
VKKARHSEPAVMKALVSPAQAPPARRLDVEAGSAAPRVDWPVYPRRAEHNTVAKGGNRRWAETARQNAFQSRWPRAAQRTPGPAELWGARATRGLNVNPPSPISMYIWRQYGKSLQRNGIADTEQWRLRCI